MVETVSTLTASVLCVYRATPAQASTWTLQAKRMDLMGLETEQIGVVNPVFAMIFIPMIDRCVLPLWSRAPCPWVRPTALRRIGLGMTLASLSFLLAAGVEQVRTEFPLQVSVTPVRIG